VLKQIEKGMTDAQLAAIAAMRLTRADLQSWTQENGGSMPGVGRGMGGTQGEGGMLGQGGGNVPPGMSEDQIAQMRQQMQNMSPEERATRRAQFGGAGDVGRVTPVSNASVIQAVVVMLTKRGGLDLARTASVQTATPSPTEIPVEEMPTATVEATTVPTQAPTPTLTVDPTVTVTAAVPAAAPTTTPMAVPAAMPTATPLPALTRREDTDPGPPFTIEISSNTAVQDPLVEASQRYKITGLVRNDGDQTYAVSAIHVTFYDADGFRGTFTPAIRDGKVVGGEWDSHAEPDAEFAAMLLAPGEAWPFSIEITAQNMASFLIHPDAVPTERESVPVELSEVRVVQDSTGFVRFTGMATNTGTVDAKNLTVGSALLDANGQVVSVGAVYVLQEGIAPGEAVPFDLRVEKQPFVDYRLYAQAERDW